MATSKSELDRFLEQATEGEFHSSGCFTLDVARANQVLGRHQAENPDFYLLKLVQAGVAAGAEAVDLLTGPDTTQVTFFGADLLEVKHADVLAALHNPELRVGQDALAHLSCGLNAALGLEPQQIEWRAYRGEAQSLTLTSTGLRVSALPPVEAEGAVAAYGLFLRHPRRSKFRRFWRDVFGHSALKALAFCPMQVRQNGQVLNRPAVGRPSGRIFAMRPHLLENYYLTHEANAIAIPEPGGRSDPGGEGVPLYCVEARYYDAQGQQMLSLPSSDCPAFCITALPQGSRALPSRVFLYHFGVHIETIEVDLGKPYLDAWITTHGLTLDLGQTKLVRDQAWQSRLKEVTAMARSRT